MNNNSKKLTGQMKWSPTSMKAASVPSLVVVNHTRRTIEEVAPLSARRVRGKLAASPGALPVFYFVVTDVMKACINLMHRSDDGAFTAGALWGLLVHDRVALLWPESRPQDDVIAADCVDLAAMMMRADLSVLRAQPRAPLSTTGSLLWRALGDVIEEHCTLTPEVPQFTLSVRREFLRGLANAMTTISPKP